MSDEGRDQIAALQDEIDEMKDRLAKLEIDREMGKVWRYDFTARMLNTELTGAALLESGIQAAVQHGDLRGVHAFLQMYRAGQALCASEQKHPDILKAFNMYSDRLFAMIETAIRSAEIGPTAGNA